MLARDRWLALLTGVGLFACYVVVQRGVIGAVDAKIMLAVAQSILHGGLAISRAADPSGWNSPYSAYGIGESLVMAPLLALQQALHARPDLIVSLANPLLMSTAGAASFLAGRAMGFGRRAALGTTLLAGLLTMALQATTEQLSEPGVALGIALTVLGLLRWRACHVGGAGLAGLGMALAVLFRVDSVLVVAAVGVLAVPLFIPPARLRREVRGIVLLAVPLAAAGAWTAYYTWLRTGNPIPGPYGPERFTTPLLVGLYGLLVSRGVGFVFYNPALLLALPGAVLVWCRDRAVAVLLIALAVVRPLFYARWGAWWGGVTWGPRFLMPATVPLALLAGEALRRIGRLPTLLRAVAVLLAAALVVAAAVVNLASVWIGYEAAWLSAHNNTIGYFYTFRVGPLGWNLDHLGRAGGYFALSHFVGGPRPVGVAAAGVAVAVLGSAGWLANRGDRAERSCLS